jgi:hypothetical protein
LEHHTVTDEALKLVGAHFRAISSFKRSLLTCMKRARVIISKGVWKVMAGQSAQQKMWRGGLEKEFE